MVGQAYRCDCELVCADDSLKRSVTRIVPSHSFNGAREGFTILWASKQERKVRSSKQQTPVFQNKIDANGEWPILPAFSVRHNDVGAPETAIRSFAAESKDVIVGDH
jgi:hypothetical protein